MKKSGFTLIELMVVVTLIAICSAIVSMSLPDPDQRRLTSESDRLGILLEAGREESRTIGGTVYWRVNENNTFEFLGVSNEGKLPTKWLNPEEKITVVMTANNKPIKMLVLGPEPVIPIQTVVLYAGKYKATLTTDGLSSFTSEVTNVEPNQ